MIAPPSSLAELLANVQLDINVDPGSNKLIAPPVVALLFSNWESVIATKSD